MCVLCVRTFSVLIILWNPPVQQRTTERTCNTFLYSLKFKGFHVQEDAENPLSEIYRKTKRNVSPSYNPIQFTASTPVQAPSNTNLSWEKREIVALFEFPLLDPCTIFQCWLLLSEFMQFSTLKPTLFMRFSQLRLSAVNTITCTRCCWHNLLQLQLYTQSHVPVCTYSTTRGCTLAINYVWLDCLGVPLSWCRPHPCPCRRVDVENQPQSPRATGMIAFCCVWRYAELFSG